MLPQEAGSFYAELLSLLTLELNGVNRNDMASAGEAILYDVRASRAVADTVTEAGGTARFAPCCRPI